MPAGQKRKRTVMKISVGGTTSSNDVSDKRIKKLSDNEARVKLGDKGMAKLKAKKGEQFGDTASVTTATQSTSQTTAQPKRKLSQTEKNRVAKNESQRRISEVEGKREQRKAKKKAKK